MNLEYNILWVENEDVWYETVEEDLKPIVESHGLTYKCHRLTGEDPSIDYHKFDLILMDMNLSSEPTGDLIIKKIRDLEIYTTVVFYSASGMDALKVKGKESDLDGVFYSGRNIEIFTEKVEKIVEASLKKVEDIVNLRGVVMAEVSELDSLMDEIIKKYYTKEPSLLDTFHTKITNKKEKETKDSLIVDSDEPCKKNCSLIWRTWPIEVLITKIDAVLKVRSVRYVMEYLEKKGKTLSIGSDGFYDIYYKEIVSKRNFLAHCKSIVAPDGSEILQTWKGDFSFSKNDIAKIRIDIKKYHVLFEKILNE